MRRVWSGLILAFAAGLMGFFAGADEPAAGEAVVIDIDGKEHKLTGVKFTTGTRRLTWLADPAGTTEDEKKGPLAIELREPNSTTLTQGILTLVPVSSIESATYDFDRQLMSLAVNGVREPLNGILGYQRINVLGFSGTVDGKATSFSGGIRGKPTVKSVTFGGAQPVAKRKPGITWNIQIVQPKADNPTLNVRNLKVLYATTGAGEQLAAGLLVRKGMPLVFDAALKRFEMLATDPNTNLAVAEIETGTGPERIIATPLVQTEDKKTTSLVGMVGEVDAGWKLFPLHTIKVITPSKRKIE